MCLVLKFEKPYGYLRPRVTIINRPFYRLNRNNRTQSTYGHFNNFPTYKYFI